MFLGILRNYQRQKNHFVPSTPVSGHNCKSQARNYDQIVRHVESFVVNFEACSVMEHHDDT